MVTCGLLVIAVAASVSTTRVHAGAHDDTTGGLIIRGSTLETCLAGSSQAQGGPTCCHAGRHLAAEQQLLHSFESDVRPLAVVEPTYVDTDGSSGIGATTFDSSTTTVTIPAIEAGTTG